MRAALVAFVTALAVGGCPPPQQQTSPPATPVEPEPPPDQVAPPDGTGGLAADGASCMAGAECESGLCEGEGCGADQPGTCVSKQRACTRDLRSYCGCDGQVFQGSGSCPNRRFANRGECSSSGAKAADGAACSAAADCESGLCEGEGCGENAGVCVSRKRPCTADLRPYCGCDGKTFQSSGTCANRLYAHKGECKTKK